MYKEDYIEGGYTMWARKTLESEIFFDKPAEWFKIWFYIVNKVFYSDGQVYNRGSNRFTYSEISNFTSATYSQVKHCIDYLTTTKMIDRQKTRRNVIITVNNFGKYQEQKTYTRHSKDKQATDIRHTYIDKKEKERENKRKKEIYIVDIPPKREKVEEYIKNNGYPVDIDKWFAHYEAIGWKVGKNKMKSWEAAVRTWLPNGWHKKKKESKFMK